MWRTHGEAWRFADLTILTSSLYNVEYHQHLPIALVGEHNERHLQNYTLKSDVCTQISLPLLYGCTLGFEDLYSDIFSLII
jgi:hypothetical protein